MRQRDRIQGGVSEGAHLDGTGNWSGIVRIGLDRVDRASRSDEICGQHGVETHIRANVDEDVAGVEESLQRRDYMRLPTCCR